MTTSRWPERTATSLRVLLPGDVTAPAIARHAVRDALSKLGVAAARVEDVLLATSELVTNAFEHGDRPRLLELEHHLGRLVLRVHDTGRRLPELRSPSPAEARSRGLVLVDSLSETWGYERCADGKYVWAVFLLDDV